jgi:hypothetical protein
MAGMSEEADLDNRRFFTKFIQNCGMHLDLPQETVALAQLLFQRFFTVEKYDKFNHYAITRISLILACKVRRRPFIYANRKSCQSTKIFEHRKC